MRDCVCGRVRRTPWRISLSQAPSIRAAGRDVARPHLDADDRRYRGPQPCPDYGTDQVPTQLGDLPHDALDVRLDRGNVDAFGVAVRKQERTVVWHVRGFARGLLLNR